VAKESKSSGVGIKIAIISGIVVIVALLVVVIILLLRNNKTTAESEKRNVVVTQDSAEEIAEQMIQEEYIPTGYYSTQMSTTWHFAKGDAVSEDAYVKNDKSNTNDVYFDVFLADDESKPILQSPVIPRGGELENISLDTALKAGTYECVMVYHLVDDDQNTVSTLRVGFTIIVEK